MLFQLSPGVACFDLSGLRSRLARLVGMGDPVARHFAMVTPSPLVNQVVKKAGSAVFQRSASSAVVRKHTIPRQPRTPAQMAVRGNFSTNSKNWSGQLDAAAVAAWNAAAATLIFTNRLGQKHVPSGIQLYQLCTRNLQAAETTPLALPVVPLVTAGPVGVAVVISVSGTEIEVTVSSPASATQIPIIRVSKVLPTGKTKVGKKLTQVTVEPMGDPGPWNIWSYVVPSLTVAQILMNLFVGVRYVDTVTGGGSLEITAMGAIGT